MSLPNFRIIDKQRYGVRSRRPWALTNHPWRFSVVCRGQHALDGGRAGLCLAVWGCAREAGVWLQVLNPTPPQPAWIANCGPWVAESRGWQHSNHGEDGDVGNGHLNVSASCRVSQWLTDPFPTPPCNLHHGSKLVLGGLGGQRDPFGFFFILFCCRSWQTECSCDSS